MLMLNEDESFSLSGYVETPGEVRVVPKGYIVSHRSDGTYMAPLIPQLFYGADGTQLQTWRQNITQAGEQVLLSRSAGQPEVPREELYWRKVPGPKTEEERVAEHYRRYGTTELPPRGFGRLQIQEQTVLPIIIIGGLLLLLVLGKR